MEAFEQFQTLILCLAVFCLLIGGIIGGSIVAWYIVQDK